MSSCSQTPTTLDPLWIIAARRAASEVERVDQARRVSGGSHNVSVSVPRNLQGDEVTLHRQWKQSESPTKGEWVLWTVRGPIALWIFEGRWEASAEHFICQHADDEEVSALELETWIEERLGRDHSFATRRELIAVIRETIRREQTGELPRSQPLFEMG